MKTEKEILSEHLTQGEMEHLIVNELPMIYNAMREFATQFQSQSSISAEEDWRDIETSIHLALSSSSKQLEQLTKIMSVVRFRFKTHTKFASRQGKVVEISDMKYDFIDTDDIEWYLCPECKESDIASIHNFCPNCGAKINWIN